MTTFNKDILGIATRSDPTQTTDPVFPAPYNAYATNDVWKHNVLVFGGSNVAAPTVRTGIFGLFKVPDNYVGTALIVIDWSATLTTGDVVWDFEYRTVSGNDTTSYDQAGTEESVTVTDTAPGAANRRLEVTVALTSANLAAGEMVEFGFYRDGADAADTMAGSALLFNLCLRYNDV